MLCQSLLSYYEANTKKDQTGKVLSFGATAKVGNGQRTFYTGEAQQVALFSSRGPNVKDFNFNEADVLKPNVMGPGFLIWGAWTPIAVDNAAYQGIIYIPLQHLYVYAELLVPSCASSILARQVLVSFLSLAFILLHQGRVNRIS